jgi:hypothetical protein
LELDKFEKLKKSQQGLNLVDPLYRSLSPSDLYMSIGNRTIVAWRDVGNALPGKLSQHTIRGRRIEPYRQSKEVEVVVTPGCPMYLHASPEMVANAKLLQAATRDKQKGSKPAFQPFEFQVVPT